jgi:YbbR domain-containing protein
VSWDRFKHFFTRNWREKLVAVLLAFLFWFMIKSQISPPPRYEPPLPPLRAV